jgi:hypothetical protein
LVVGVALVAVGDTTVGPWVTVGGMAAAIWGAHRLGRSGPDGVRSLLGDASPARAHRSLAGLLAWRRARVGGRTRALSPRRAALDRS